jgi:hypothetical protein
MLRTIVIALLLVVAAACSSKKTSPRGTGSGSGPVGSGAPASGGTAGSAAGTGTGTGSASARVPPPTFALYANEVNAAKLVRGQPLLLSLVLAHPDPTAPKVDPVVIAAAGAKWTDAIRIEVLDAKQKPQTWPLHALVDQAEPTLRLDDKQRGFLAWRLSVDEASAIAPGTYQVVAHIDTTGAKAAGAWLGTRTSTVTVQVGAAATATDRSATALLLAREAAWGGDAKQARAHVDALLAKEPTHIDGLTAAGDLASAAGNVDEALDFYNRALTAVAKKSPRTHEPPRELIRRRNAELDKWFATQKQP